MNLKSQYKEPSATLCYIKNILVDKKIDKNRKIKMINDTVDETFVVSWPPLDI